MTHYPAIELIRSGIGAITDNARSLQLLHSQPAQGKIIILRNRILRLETSKLAPTCVERIAFRRFGILESD